ncbi:MAG: hypothetical protein RhofKO_24560 [Rhodothermales bacterium]
MGKGRGHWETQEMRCMHSWKRKSPTLGIMKPRNTAVRKAQAVGSKAATLTADRLLIVASAFQQPRFSRGRGLAV